MGSVWRNLRIMFQPNKEFDKAALYTTDLWLHEEDHNDNLPAPPYTPAPTTPVVMVPTSLRPPPVMSVDPAAQSWGGTLEMDWNTRK
jgi:hypothetical protein